MEHLEGKSLDELLHEELGRGMPFSRACQIIEDVGAALGYGHDHNVIHSDVKPANVFVTGAGKSKLLDFGIARVSRAPLKSARSKTLALTPLYASCESARWFDGFGWWVSLGRNLEIPGQVTQPLDPPRTAGYVELSSICSLRMAAIKRTPRQPGRIDLVEARWS